MVKCRNPNQPRPLITNSALCQGGGDIFRRRGACHSRHNLPPLPCDGCTATYISHCGVQSFPADIQLRIATVLARYADACLTWSSQTFGWQAKPLDLPPQELCLVSKVFHKALTAPTSTGATLKTSVCMTVATGGPQPWRVCSIGGCGTSLPDEWRECTESGVALSYWVSMYARQHKGTIDHQARSDGPERANDNACTSWLSLVLAPLLFM